MRGRLSFLIQLITSWMATAAMFVYISGCAGGALFDQVSSLSNALSGYIAVSSVATQTTTTLTGPGYLTLFDPNGNFVRVLADYFAGNEYSTGIAVFGTTLFSAVDGSDRFELINATNGNNYVDVVHASLTATPLRGIVASTAGEIFVVEYNTNQIEKFDSGMAHVGNPFINTTVGACVLASPWGITYISSTNQLVVAQAGAGRILFYNATTGACDSSVTNAAYGSTATAIVYHPQTNKILVARIGDEAIYQASVAGAAPAVAYLNAGRVTDPYAMAVDSNGYVYIGSSGTDTVEKFSFNGTTLTPVSSIVGPNGFTQNPTGIVVFP